MDLEAPGDDAPVVRLVHSIIAAAIERGASDIHFDATAGDMDVRYRVDGVMWDSTSIPRRMVRGAVSRIKIMAELDIAERRRPQDGRISLSLDGRVVDIRLVTLPTVEGESIVMRILEKTDRRPDVRGDGHGRQADRDRFEAAIRRSHGAVIVTGPTGSGKSTTLYSALGAIQSPEKTIITIEDPVEVRMAGMKQIQVNSKTGLDFAAGLRSMMRADPDVIMVGEIRDRETALTAIESSLTGHLILSTLHTNDAPGAVTRLIEMGIEPFLVASSVTCVVGQRLARALCDACKEPRDDLRGDAARERLRGGRGHRRPTARSAASAAARPATAAGSGSSRSCRSHADPRAHPRARDGRERSRDLAVSEGMTRMRRPRSRPGPRGTHLDRGSAPGNGGRLRTMKRVRGQAGFTMVEVMVAASILMVGVLGTLAMLDAVSKRSRTAANRQAGAGARRATSSRPRASCRSARSRAARSSPGCSRTRTSAGTAAPPSGRSSAATRPSR